MPRRRALYAVAIVTLSCLAASAQEQPGTELEELRITAPVAPLDASLLRLRRLAEASLPCLGCGTDAGAQAHNPALSLLEYLLLPAEPAPRDFAAQLAAEVRYDQLGPDLGPRR